MKNLFVVGDSNINSLKESIEHPTFHLKANFSKIFYLPTNPFMAVEAVRGINPVDDYLSGNEYSLDFVSSPDYPHLQKLYDLYYSDHTKEDLTSYRPTEKDLILHIGREFGVGQRLIGRYGPVVMQRMPIDEPLPDSEKRFSGMKYLPKFPIIPIVTRGDDWDYDQQLLEAHNVITWDLAYEMYKTLAINLRRKVGAYSTKSYLIEAPPPAAELATLFWGNKYAVSGNYLLHIKCFHEAFQSVFSSAHDLKVELEFCEQSNLDSMGFTLNKFALDMPDLHVTPDFFIGVLERIMGDSNNDFRKPI